MLALPNVPSLMVVEAWVVAVLVFRKVAALMLDVEPLRVMFCLLFKVVPAFSVAPPDTFSAFGVAAFTMMTLPVVFKLPPVIFSTLPAYAPPSVTLATVRVPVAEL